MSDPKNPFTPDFAADRDERVDAVNRAVRDAAAIDTSVRDAWIRPAPSEQSHQDSRTDGACTCGQHQDAKPGPKRGDPGTMMRRTIDGTEHVYKIADYVSAAAIDDEIDALNRVLARCGKRDQAAGFCK